MNNNNNQRKLLNNQILNEMKFKINQMKNWK